MRRLKMGKCIHHSDRETSFLCMKDNVYLCEECLECRNPNIYCKFRSSCPIWFMRKETDAWDKEKGRKKGLKRSGSSCACSVVRS